MIPEDLFGKRIVEINFDEVVYIEGILFLKYRLLKKLGKKHIFLDILRDYGIPN